MRTTVRFLALVLSACGAAASPAQADEEAILLWPDGAPGAVGTEDRDKPLIWVYPAPKETNTGTGVVICPGGGYGALAVDHEGTQVARWFNSVGVNAFVLKYRLAPRYKHPAPMNDVQRALQLVRARAADFGIVRHRIGVMGFSAGGHLASTAATHFADARPDAADKIEQQSSRPDFAILAYPVITMSEPFGHTGSRNNLLGPNPDPELAKFLSNDLQVTERTPPTFLFHTGDDAGVPIENSLAFYAACRRHKVPAELHAYQFGPHGVGLAPGDPALFTWKDRLHDWLRNSGMLADGVRMPVSGRVKVAGEPLKWGQIRFTPIDRPNEPIAFGMIRNGEFRIAGDRGPTIGAQRVDVVRMGDVVPHPTRPDADEVTQAVDLTVEIKAGENTIGLSIEP